MRAAGRRRPSCRREVAADTCQRQRRHDAPMIRASAAAALGLRLVERELRIAARGRRRVRHRAPGGGRMRGRLQVRRRRRRDRAGERAHARPTARDAAPASGSAARERPALRGCPHARSCRSGSQAASWTSPSRGGPSPSGTRCSWCPSPPSGSSDSRSMSSRNRECMKKARLKVVGVKSPEKSSVPPPCASSWISA